MSGSLYAFSENTACRIERKLWFSVSESVVGGSFVVVPMASSGFGGDVGRRERM